MALNIDAIARRLNAIYRSTTVVPTTAVDSVVPLADLSVTANPEFATIVTGEVEFLRPLLANNDRRLAALSSAVFVTNDAVAAAELYAQGFSVMVAPESDDTESIHHKLDALIALDQAAEDRLVASGSQVLTQVARRGGALAVVVELAQRIDGWAVLLDEYGEEIVSAGAGRLHTQDAKAVAFNRPVRIRHPGLQVHHVGTDTDLTGFLVISSRSPSTSRTRNLAALAASLLDLILRTHDSARTERLGRDLLIDVLSDGGPRSTSALRRWGIHDSSLTGFALGSRSSSVDVERVTLRLLDDVGAAHTVALKRGRMLGFIRNHMAEALANAVTQFNTGREQSVAVGLGKPHGVDLLARSSNQALDALESALLSQRSVLHYAELPTVDLILDRLASTDHVQLGSLLAPLSAEGGAQSDLLRTLEAFLLENANHLQTATRLNIHRQTLRNRLERIEDLTRLSLGNVDDRVALWLAIRSRQSEQISSSHSSYSSHRNGS